MASPHTYVFPGLLDLTFFPAFGPKGHFLLACSLADPRLFLPRLQEDIMRIVEFSDEIRRRRRRHRELDYEREYYDDREMFRSSHHHGRHRRGSFDDDEYREREVIVEHRPGRAYIM